MIAGERAAVERAMQAAKELGARRAVMLPVSAPFHSSLLKPAAEKLAQRLAQVPFASPSIPVLHNVDVAQHATADEIRAALAAQAASPVRWTQTIAGVRRAGRDARRRMRSRQGAREPREAHRRQARGVRTDQRIDARRYALAARGAGMTMADGELAGQVALVTGATRGIGKAIALALARDGATVVGTATTADGAASISGYLADAGRAGKGIALDVTDAAATDAALADIEKTFGAITILVNNAGITRDNLLLRMKDDEWDAIMATNLKPAFRLAKAVLRGMMKARHGRIIQIGSVVGSSGNAGQANYAAAKAALIGFTKSLAQEVGSRNITVNCVSPGFIDTDMTKALPEAQREALLSRIPLGRLGAPDDIASAVAFLAGPRAGYITGTTLHVNGGMYMA